ncbi:MAG: iron donor protein CyaY [Azoarcus sp.]|nr:iron donor protein CyaY [Azoarcus sp.]
MDEAAFVALASAELARIEDILENGGLDLDLEVKADGVLEVGFDDGGKIVINRHVAAREIWVAARSGGFHFHLENGIWVERRAGVELYALLSRLLSERAGKKIVLGAMLDHRVRR